MSRPESHKLNRGTPTRHLVGAVVLASVAAVTMAACADGASTRGAKTSAGGAGGVSSAASRASSNGAAPTDSAARQSADSAAAMALVRDNALARKLSPAADSMVPYLVFAPADERQFVAAVRNKEWLLDVGRLDVDVRKDSVKLRAFREAAAALTPVRDGAWMRLAWAKASEDVTVGPPDVYNGRIVLRLRGTPALDSVAHSGKGSPVAVAVRRDTASMPVPTTCDLRADPDSAAQAAQVALTPAERKVQAAARKAADSAFDARVAFVRDSLEAVLRLDHPPYERLQRKVKLATSSVRGCWGPARRALIVSLRAGDAEWVREKTVLIAPEGAVTPLRVDDLRFRAHDLLTAFDADGDGVDDLAVKGTTQRAGATTVLRVDLAKKRAERLAAGFAWESF